MRTPPRGVGDHFLASNKLLSSAALHDEVCVEVGGELDVVLMEIADAADGRGTVSRIW